MIGAKVGLRRGDMIAIAWEHDDPRMGYIPCIGFDHRHRLKTALVGRDDQRRAAYSTKALLKLHIDTRR